VSRLAAWAVFVLALSLLTACGGSKADAYGESKAVTINGTSVTVKMKNIQFSPQGIKVRPGTTVTWVNDDGVMHNVRQVESTFLSPDAMRTGESFSFRFDRPGTYRYQCTLHHPTMNGVVIVEGR
jgi:plastocyanin